MVKKEKFINRPVLLVFCVSVSCGVPAIGQSESQPAPFVFASAYYQDGQVRLAPSNEIDWESIAPERWRRLDTKAPDMATLNFLREKKDEMFGFSEIQFEAPVPDTMKQHAFYYISAQGIVRVTPAKLLGTVRFEFNEEQTNMYRSYYGEVVVTAENELSQSAGGFALMLNGESEYAIKESEATSAMVKEAFRTDDSLKDETRIADPAYWTIARQFEFTFSVSERSYVFVKLAPDEGCKHACCGDRYVIITTGEHPAIAAWNYFHCDV